MATYTSDQLYGAGVATEEISGATTFLFGNSSTGSVYFTMEQVKNVNGNYSGSTTTNAIGTFSAFSGIDDATLMTAFVNNTMFELKFDNDGAAGVHTYTISNCILTDLSVEGIEAGAEGALMINATFEGLSFVRDA